MNAGLDYSIAENVPPELSAQRKTLRGLSQLKFDLKYFFIQAAIGNAQDLLHLLEEFPADVIVADSFFIAADWVHEQTGIPWAQLGVSALTLPSQDTAPFGLGLKPNASPLGRFRNRILYGLLQTVIFRSLYADVNEARSQVSLGATNTLLFDVLSPYLYLAGTVPGFEYPRSDLPPQVHFIGPLLPATSSTHFTPPSWWDELNQDIPVILVTQGTVATDLADLIIPTLQALKHEPVLVVATTGNRSAADLGAFSPPDNARVEPFIPFQSLLPFVDVMVTNGGYNGVQMALAHGIPLVAAGKSEDKAEICARIAWRDIGINLNTKTPKPKQIRQAVQQVLSDPRYRQNAKQLQTEVAQLHPAEQAVALLEALVQTKQPIIRCP
ncbi:glycosyltransferase [Egbenema bharatensis]|uniref:glycosyltransferase n=1 Tax=Egbenema bharatensis TaxID=3463334 RepID=UPI003A8A86FA